MGYKCKEIPEKSFKKEIFLLFQHIILKYQNNSHLFSHGNFKLQ